MRLWLRRYTKLEYRRNFTDADVASAWLTSSRLLRKSNLTGQAYQAMLHAAQLKDRSATIEHARLLWKDGHHRKAIQTLDAAISSNEFVSSTTSPMPAESRPSASLRAQHQNMLAARVRSSCKIVLYGES